MLSEWNQEEILSQFRQWLQQTAQEIEALDDIPPESAMYPHLPETGLLQLVEAFTALRHELKLQTKGSRNLESTVEEALSGLEKARREFQTAQSRGQETDERAGQPLVEALITLDEGLLRAGQVFQSTHAQITESVPFRLREQLDGEFQKLSWWTRWRARRWHDRVRQLAAQVLAEAVNEEFASLMQGIQLLQTRLSRMLQEQGIKRLDKTGGAVDPTKMTVVELVTQSDAPAETVVDVIRPGYLWKERVVRFAEVRAVASQTTWQDL